MSVPARGSRSDWTLSTASQPPAGAQGATLIILFSVFLLSPGLNEIHRYAALIWVVQDLRKKEKRLSALAHSSWNECTKCTATRPWARNAERSHSIISSCLFSFISFGPRLTYLCHEVVADSQVWGTGNK